jgi:phosphate transport system substrate-binding protein
LQTRKIADSLAVVPIDLNDNGIVDNNEKIYASLDDVLDFISTTGNKAIPQENVNIVINKNKISKDALQFLQWIITEGQQYNRHFGFMNLDKTVVSEQLSFINQFASTAGKQ